MTTPLFQHRHHKALAELFSDAGSRLTREQLVALLEKDNPRFDRTRFIGASIGRPTSSRDRR